MCKSLFVNRILNNGAIFVVLKEYLNSLWNCSTKERYSGLAHKSSKQDYFMYDRVRPGQHDY